MAFRQFKQQGKDVIINIDNIISIRKDEATGKTIILSSSQSNDVDESLDEVKVILGIGPKKEIRGF